MHTPSSAEMADKFPNFSLGIIQFRGLFFYDLDNEEENEFLAALDLENVNVSDEVDTVTVKKPTEAPK